MENFNYSGQGADVRKRVPVSGLVVTVVYRNEKLAPVCEKEYELSEYTTLIKNDIMRIITDVEDALYEATGKKKSEWPPSIMVRFDKIKHKLLDKAGEVSRIPENISIDVETPVYVDSVPEAVKEMLDAISGIKDKAEFRGR